MISDEEAQANAIGTRYLQADLLSAGDAAKVRALLRGYLDQRILFYTTRDGLQLHQVNAYTANLQDELWPNRAPTAPRPSFSGPSSPPE